MSSHFHKGQTFRCKPFKSGGADAVWTNAFSVKFKLSSTRSVAQSKLILSKLTVPVDQDLVKDDCVVGAHLTCRYEC